MRRTEFRVPMTGRRANPQVHDCPSLGATEGINKLAHFTETKTKKWKNPK